IRQHPRQKRLAETVGFRGVAERAEGWSGGRRRATQDYPPWTCWIASISFLGDAPLIRKALTPAASARFLSVSESKVVKMMMRASGNSVRIAAAVSIPLISGS